jgi:hypothetical protein
MKETRLSDNRIKELIRMGSDFTPIPRKTEERVLALIREKTTAAPRPSLFGIFRYSPVLGAAVAALVILPLAAVLAGALFFPGAEQVPLVAVSDKGGVVTGRETPLHAGVVLAEKDVIRTGPREQVALERKGLIDVQLFSNSVLELARFSDTRRELALRLTRGSMYIHKKNPEDRANPVTVGIDSFTFTLKGTRVYFAVDAARLVRVICYEGIIEATAASSKQGEVVLSLAAGESAVLKEDGTWTRSTTVSLPEQALDADLRHGLPRLDFIKELPVAGAPLDRLPQTDTDAGETIAPYTVTALGSIASQDPAEEGIRFYGAAEAGGRLFLVNRQSVFTLEAKGVVARPGLVGQATFMVRPFPAGKFAAFVKPGAIVLVDPVDLKMTHTVTLPKDGSIDHNFLPCAIDGNICLPVQNNGYYVLDPEAAGAGLRLLVKEPFPVGPRPAVAGGAALYIGSYYNKYVGAVTASGGMVYQFKLNGSSAVNFVVADRSLFLYAVEPAGSFLVRLSEAGKETGRWPLPAALKADFRAAGSRLAGVSADGRLFVLDTVTGKNAVIDRIVKRELSSRQWRNLELCVDGNLLYAPTDRGSLLVVNLIRGQKEDEIFVKPGEEFYTAPFFFKGTLYAVANSGVVYRIVKNAR